MILERRETEDGDVQFVSPDGEYRLGGVHRISADCYIHGCVIHSPSTWALSDAPYDWRGDTGVMERICKHGVGHIDADSADRNYRMGRGFLNVHACDGCCG